MARPVRAMLPSILVVVLLFHFQVADSSRPLSTEERQRPLVDPTAPAAVVHRAEPHHHRAAAAETGTGRVAVETTTEDDGSRASTRAEEGGAAAVPLLATTTSARGKDEQADDGVGSRNGRAAAAVQVLLRSRLARRFLAGEVEGGADSAARPSCRSSDVHIGCTPPSEH